MLRSLLLLLSVGLAWPAAGCREQSPGPEPSSQPNSPREVFEHLRKSHAFHSYQSMLPWIQPALRNDVIDLLVAVDELMGANTSAQVAIGQSCPALDPKKYDMSKLLNFLGMFSRDAEFVSERIEGDTAVVTMQIARRLPLKTVRFRKHEGRWCYVPTESKSGLATSIRLLAKGLNRFAAVVAAETCAPERVESEFHYRVGLKLDAFTQLLMSASPPASKASSSPG